MSGAAESHVVATVNRTKDGVPMWSGEASLFVQYEEAALLWEQSLTWEKRYTAGPKLVQELSGAARRLVAGQPPGWVAYRGGVRVLMDHLRQGLGKPRVNEVTDLLAAYFKGTKRRAQESMNDYITRKTEAYMRACQALKRVQPYYEPSAKTDRTSGRRNSGDGGLWTWGRQWTPASEGDGGARGDGATYDDDDGDAQTNTDVTATTTAGSGGQRSNHDWWAPAWGPWNSWSWNSGWSGSQSGWRYQGYGSSSTASFEEDHREQELLPVFIQGWYLLTDASLDSHERNLIITALNGNFNPARVAQELRNQFPETEVKRRDHSRRYQSYLGEVLEGDEEEGEDQDGDTVEDYENVFNEEGFAMMTTAEDEAQTAMAAIQTARRTLRDARQRQHMVKQNRKYYQGSGPRTSNAGHAKPKDDSNLDCLRCGKKGHRAANCPHKPIGDGPSAQANLAQASSSGEPQQAPFVCYMDQAEAQNTEETTTLPMNNFVGYVTEEAFQTGAPEAPEGPPTTSEAVARGMAVIDGGATQTIGSVRALEAVLNQNRKKYGSSGLKGLSSDEPPTFAFGNSTENRCLSTAQIHVQANGSPGHQLLSLTEDWMSQSTEAKQAIPRNGKDTSVLSGNGEDFKNCSDPCICEMDKLSRPALVLSLKGYGETPPSNWTKVELCARLQELADKGEIIPPKKGKTKTPLEEAVAALNRAAAKKSTLQAHVTNMGIKVTGNETMAILQQRAMQHLIATTDGTEEDKIGFGKYASQTYGHVRQYDEQYCRWAITTAQEGECSMYLSRFATWLQANPKPATPAYKPKVDMNKFVEKKEKPSGSGDRKATSEASSPELKEHANASAGTSEKMMMELMKAVASLTEEVQTLKNERGEKTRKVATKSDATMEEPEELTGRAKVTVPVEARSGVDKTCPRLNVSPCERNEAWRLPIMQNAVELQGPPESQQPEAAFLSNTEAQNLEQEAKQHSRQGQKPTTKDLENLLRKYPLKNLGQSRRNLEHASDYHTFGTYAFGNHYGVTRRTTKLPELCRCVNRIMKQYLPASMKWTSFVINCGTTMPVHRDVNNSDQYPNGSVGFGEFRGGGLWLEGKGSLCGRIGKDSVRSNPQGEAIQGQEYDIQERAVIFSPKQWHGSCAWEGERWVVTVYVCRGWSQISEESRDELRSLGFPVPSDSHCEAYPAEAHVHERERKREDERIRKKLYLLHCATGHSNPKHMVQALQRRGADDRVLQLAKEFKCDVCKEKQRPPPRNLASLEPLPPKLYTIGADIGHWAHPHTGESHQFMIIVDEGSRFKAGRILSTGSKSSPNAQACLSYLQEGWVQYFGHPRALRLDPAGAFRSTAVEEWCDRHSIYLDIVPGEAHWKIGSVENAVRGVKELMSKLAHYDSDITASEALAEAIWAFNHREIIRGFSPAQHILGQAPDETGRFLSASTEVHPNLLVENPTEEFERGVQRRAEAEKALSEWTAKQRLMRAQHSKHRPCYDYEPGELVYYWRSQESNKSRRQPGGKHGRFLGPARVLATETRKSSDGLVRPGGSIWLVKGRSLLKCAPEQLRRATEREQLVEALAAPTEGTTPWTFKAVATEIGGNKYEDLSQDLPPVEEWNRAQQLDSEAQPTRHRIRGKRHSAPPTAEGDMELDEEAALDLEEPDAQLPQRERSRSRGRGRDSQGNHVDQPAAWWTGVPETKWPDQQSGYWSDKAAAVEVEFSFPESKRGKDHAFQDLGAYFVGNMRRRAVELTERRMSEDEKAAFRGAKAIEVKNFVASKAFEVLPDHLKPSKDEAIGMRWILTWKLREDGSRKAKARAVLLGYQDGGYEHRSTTSPVMTRTTRQALLQLSAWKRWSVKKGDVTGAFLQSRQYPDDLFCIPCPEICEALGIVPGSVTRVKRACYGLVDAPLEWYRSEDEFLRSLGFTRTWADACCWVLREGGELRGAISGHVDDFLFCGRDGDALWDAKLQAIREKFKWGDWESGRFTQCGVIIEQKPEGFELSQPTYLDTVQEIGVNASRRKDRSQPTTDREKTQLRALLGGISWHAQQVAPYLAAEVGLLLTEVSRSTVDTIIKANVLLATAKSKKDHVMKIHSFKENDNLTMVAWVDAAQGNRSDGGSTQGIFIGVTTTELLEGKIAGVSPLAWTSQKIDRACRSPGASESQAAVNGEDALYAARFQWSELLYGKPDLHHPDDLVKRTGGCVVTDSRNVYDKLETEVLVIKGAEKRTSIELLAVKESQQNTKVEMRWVHSEAQRANSLTKAGTVGAREYELYHRMGHQWRLVEDEAMMSAKRRKVIAPPAATQRIKRGTCEVITLSDHLHMTHFRAANVLATATRRALSPNHPLRRLLSVFTFGSIFINLQAMHTLIGERHVLHRSTPFVEFEGLSEVVPKSLQPLPEKHKALLKDEEFNQLPEKLKQAPYYSDGKLLFNAERNLLREFRKLYAYGAVGFCNSKDEVTGPEVKQFLAELVAEHHSAHYNTSDYSN
ncbi:RE1, partial [Symbiodinium sp. CCMP2456]